MSILVSILLVGLCGPFWAALAWAIHLLRLRVERRAERELWEQHHEPQWRVSATYPPDWERRRALVFIRDAGTCQRCRKPCGTLKCSPRAVWSHPASIRILTGAHIHHLQKRSRGGDHSLGNLSLLCEPCHLAEHPDNEFFAERCAEIKASSEARQPYKEPPTPIEEEMPY